MQTLRDSPLSNLHSPWSNDILTAIAQGPDHPMFSKPFTPPKPEDRNFPEGFIFTKKQLKDDRVGEKGSITPTRYLQTVGFDDEGNPYIKPVDAETLRSMGAFTNNLLKLHTKIDECYSKTAEDNPAILRKIARMVEAQFGIARLCDDGWKAEEFVKKQKISQCNNKKGRQNFLEDQEIIIAGGTVAERKIGRPAKVCFNLSSLKY
jgi:hypothetical protein